MKQIILTLFVPLVLVNTEPTNCPSTTPVEGCTLSDYMCSGRFGSDGCPLQDYCKAVNPNDRCSANEREICPCSDNRLACNNGPDADGCATQDDCIEMMVPNYDGTPRVCANHCPIAPCNEGEVRCPGVHDNQGCLGPETCQLRVTCGENELECPTACPDLKTCIPNDPTKICQAQCDPVCDFSQKLCPMGIDHNGCEQEKSCYPKGDECPDIACVGYPWKC